MRLRSGRRWLAAAASLMLGTLPLAAQDTLTVPIGMDKLRLEEPWLASANAAGLPLLPVKRTAFAEFMFDKTNGKFVNYHQSDDSYRIGLKTESFFRLSRAVTFYGKVDYSNFRGRNMGGSAFIKPAANPFDIVEYSDSTRGTKNLETYHLVGAVGVELSSRLSLGGKVDYTAANYAKFKDLRHKNDIFDVTTSLGLRWSPSPRIDLGAAWLFRRSIESVSFKSYGNTDRQFTSLISFGAFYGRTELYDSQGSKGYTQGSTVNPLVNTFNGGALEVNLKGERWSFFNEASFLNRKGYFGKRSTTTIVFTEHDGIVVGYSGTLNYHRSEQRHSLRLGFTHDRLNNFENIYRTENTAGNRSEVVYFGSNKVLGRTLTTISAGYALRIGENPLIPRWMFSIEGSGQERKQTVALYPHYRKQDVKWWQAAATAERRFWMGRSELRVTAGLLYGKGSGTVKNDGVYATPSASETPPKETPFNLQREFDYLTAPHAGGKVGARYTFPLRFVHSGYLQACYHHDRALSGSFEKKSLGVMNLSIGCNF